MTALGLDNRWFYVSAMAVVWVLVAVALELLFFGGDIASAVIQGVVGGAVAGLVTFSVQQNIE